MQSDNPELTFSSIYEEAKHCINNTAGKSEWYMLGTLMSLMIKSMEGNEPANMCRCLRDFHEKFGLKYTGGPRKLSKEMSNFRIKFMEEELGEYVSAVTEGCIIEQLDALVDLVYVALGTAYLHGFNFIEAFNRVHEANMKKKRAKSKKESLRDSSLDVMKPDGWKHANLRDLV